MIVLDDVFEGLDSGGKDEVKELISKLASRGKTLVLGSASFAETWDVCDRLCILHDGKLQALGDLEELLARPDALFVLAPVLPPALTRRLLAVVRQEFPAKGHAHEPGILRSSDRSPASKTGSASSNPSVAPTEKASMLPGANYAWLEALTRASSEGSSSSGKARK